MTTIHDLPEEILLMIFNMFPWDMENCQRVCRAWYFPAHIIFLNEIELHRIPAIQKFIDAIDHNPDPTYLKAVKKIEFFEINDQPFPLNNELNEKLFHRFPNLNKIVFQDPTLLANFNDQMCKTLLENCPKLEKFFVENDIFPCPGYRDLIYNAKFLATEIDLLKVEDEPPRNIIHYLNRFPRLRTLIGERNILVTNSEQLLQILEHAPDLRSICMGSGYDRQNAAARYLAKKTKGEQETLINRLSRIDYLELFYENDFCPNSLELVSKYLLGVQKFNFYSEVNRSWTDAHTRALSNLTPNLYRYNERCSIELHQISLDTLSLCFSSIVNGVYSKRTKNVRLRIWLDYTDDPNISIYNTSNYGPLISLDLHKQQHSLSDVAELLFQTSYNNVDDFSLGIHGRGIQYINPSMYLYEYNMVLCRMPYLKKLLIDISGYFVDGRVGDDCGFKLPLVKDFIIRAAIDAEYQVLLDCYYFVMPNLKHLTIFYNSGSWDKIVGEFRLKLPRYTLDSLRLDVTPVRTKTVNLLKKDTTWFFVMEVEVLNDSERHLFKISLDLSSVAIVNDVDLKGYVRGKDYFMLRVAVGSLQNLELAVVANHRINENDEEAYFTHERGSLPHVMILENSQWKTQ